MQQTATGTAFANPQRDMGRKNEYMDRHALRKFIAEDYTRWGTLERDTGIKLE